MKRPSQCLSLICSCALTPHPLIGCLLQMGMDLAAKKREVEVYRQETVQDPGNAMAWVKLGATLQEMDHYKPDGGQHVLETVNAYRWAQGAWAASPTPAADGCTQGHYGAAPCG